MKQNKVANPTLYSKSKYFILHNFIQNNFFTILILNIYKINSKLYLKKNFIRLKALLPNSILNKLKE